MDLNVELYGGFLDYCGGFPFRFGAVRDRERKLRSFNMNEPVVRLFGAGCFRRSAFGVPVRDL